MRFRVGGLNRAPLGSGEGVRFRLRGLGRASLWGEAGLGMASLRSGEEMFREREGEELGGHFSLRIS